MSVAPKIKSVPTSSRGADTVLIEKVRWSVRQRLRKQLYLLSTDFFDEVDDFLFSGGQRGQFSADSGYLKAMRELRAKQAHFDETFLDAVIRTIKASYSDQGRNEPGENSASNAGFEKVEIDLALQAIQRKAEKIYLPWMNRIDDVQARMREQVQAEVIDSKVVLRAVLDGFAIAQPVFSLPLEVRLVFIKLFEQHFVRKMERLFQDLVSIINNVNDPDFVDRLYSSSSSFRTRDSHANKTSFEAPPDADDCDKTQILRVHKPELVEQAVNQLVKAVCQDRNLPAFIDKMTRNQWREVMFVIGLNRGTTSVEWGDARHTIELLATAVNDRIELDDTDRDAIHDQLRKGFSLIQMNRRQQEDFFLDLDQYFAEMPAPISTIEAAARGKTVIMRPEDKEASISPSGQSILDQDDLDELAKMLGGDAKESPPDSRQLADFLADVDALGDHVVVEFMLQGDYAQCLLNKSVANPELFTISKQGSKISITRSRLGLALALQSGEMRISGLDLAAAPDAHTVIQSSRFRH